MSKSSRISAGDFRVLADWAGLNLDEQELSALKPLFDAYVERITDLREVELEAEDMAVVFPPDWAPRS